MGPLKRGVHLEQTPRRGILGFRDLEQRFREQLAALALLLLL